ncbi:hypothetical protein [Candidatus Sororendozoicomonas aggregata]|uniref:hypothetical protein n=1 Tax=Candidatus Sororendozoicomonas aggregata TaxID=3073239 RepID=UPI002ED0685B
MFNASLKSRRTLKMYPNGAFYAGRFGNTWNLRKGRVNGSGTDSRRINPAFCSKNTRKAGVNRSIARQVSFPNPSTKNPKPIDALHATNYTDNNKS